MMSPSDPPVAAPTPHRERTETVEPLNFHAIVGPNGMCLCGVRADGTVVTCGAVLESQFQKRLASTPEPTEPTRVVEAARQLAGCPRHGDPLVCLACEAEEDAEPAWKNDAKSWTHRCSEKGRPMTWPDQEAQAIVNAAVLTPRRQLTVILKKDHGAAQADKDIAEVLSGRTSLCVRTDVSEMYFHQLRLRVEQDPALAEKIAVLTDQSDGALVEVKLGFENELLWPVGFLQDAWAKEVEIDKARQAKNNG